MRVDQALLQLYFVMACLIEGKPFPVVTGGSCYDAMKIGGAIQQR